MYHTHDTDMQNGHIVFIYIYIYIYIYNIGILKHEKHLRLLSSGTKLFITFKERDAHSFYSDFFISPILCDTCPRPPRAIESQPSSLGAGLNSTNWLFQNPQNPPRASSAWRHPHSVAPFPIWATAISLSNTSAPRTRMNTCVNVAPK